MMQALGFKYKKGARGSRERFEPQDPGLKVS